MAIKLKTYNMNPSAKKYRKALSIAEKLDLFDEYIKETGATIDINTAYRNFPIGIMLMQIRSNITSVRTVYSDEVIKRLNIQGLLDKRLESVDEKVARLERYCGNNLQLWYLRSELFVKYLGTKEIEFLNDNYAVSETAMMKFLDDHQITPIIISEKVNAGDLSIALVIDELKKAANDYAYVRDRKAKNKLKPEYIERLKKAGVGGVFGYKTELEELSEDTGIPTDRLNKIIDDFGSMDNFRKIYIKFMLSWDFWKKGGKFTFKLIAQNKEFINRIFGGIDKFLAFKKHFLYLSKHHRIITFFDLEGNGFVPNEQTTSLGNIIGIEQLFGMFFDRDEYDRKLETLTDRQKDVICQMTDTENPKSLNGVASTYGVTKTRAMQIRNDAIEKIISEVGRPVWSLGDSKTKRKRFIIEYFKHKDIFITPDSFELSDELKKKLLDILGYEYEAEFEETSEELDAQLRDLIFELQLAYDELHQEIHTEIESSNSGARIEDERQSAIRREKTNIEK